MRNDDDSTVSSSGTVDTSLDSIRYTITKQSRTGEEGDLEFETFGVEACGTTEAAAFGRLLAGPLPVAKMDVFAVERRAGTTNDITDTTVSLQGCVCLCDFSSLKDVNTALRIAAEKGALALLSVIQPVELTESEVPVFLVATETMNKLSRHEQSTVTFHAIRGESSESSPLDHINDGATTASDQCNDSGTSTDAMGTQYESGMNDSDIIETSGNAGSSDSAMDEPGVLAPGASKPSTGAASNPIDLSGRSTTNALDMVDPTALAIASKMNAPGASSQLHIPRYAVTIHTYMGSTSGDRSWKFEVDSADAFGPLIPDVDRSYNILFADVVRNGRTNHVSKLIRPPKGRVLLYSSTNVCDVNRVQQLAHEGGAVALFVVCAPQFWPDIPLFVVDPEMLQEMSCMLLGTAKFELLDSKQPPASAIDRVLSTPRRSYAAVASGNPNGNQSSARQARGQPNAIDRKVTPSTDAWTDSDDEVNARPPKRPAGFGGNVAEKKPKKGLLSKVGAFVSNLVGFGEEPIFKALEVRSSKSILQSYGSMREKIDSILWAGDSAEIHIVVSDAESFLKEKDCALCHIAAAAYICEEAPTTELCRGLEKSVVLAVANFDVSQPEFKFLERRRNQRNQSDHIALRQILFCFLVKRVPAFAATIGHSGQIKVLLFLNACGLFRRPFQAEFWRSLRATADPNVFNREEVVALLASVAGQSFSRAVELCFQKDLNGFVGIALDYCDSTGSRPLDAYVSNILMLLVADLLGERPVESDLLFAWNACLGLLEREPFGQAPRDRIIAEFMTRARYFSRGSYSALSEMLASTGLDHPAHRRIQDCVQTQLSNDMKSGKLDWTAVGSLLCTERLANLLLSRPLGNTTLTFVNKAMAAWSSFEHKLLLIDGVLVLFVRQEGVRALYQYEQRFRTQLERAFVAESRTSRDDTTVLTEFLRIAENQPNIFAIAKSADNIFEVVAQTFVTASCAQEIARDPMLLRDLVNTGEVEAGLYDCIVNHLCMQISSQCNTLNKASTFFAAVTTEPLPVSHALRRIANVIFVAAFKKWNPVQITDIQPEHKKVVDRLIAAEATESVSDHEVNECQERVRGLLLASLGEYNNNEVTRSSLEYMLRAAKSHLWNNVHENGRAVEYPTAAAIEGKLAEVDRLEASILRSLSVTINGRTISLAEVLREYSCLDDGAWDLLRDYDYLFADHSAGRSSAKSLRELTVDNHSATQLAARGKREFYFCAYFVSHQSLLFRDGVLRKDGKAHSVRTLCNSVRTTLCWFETAFGPNSTFAGVCSAKTALSTLKSSHDSELDSLIKCSDLKTSTTDIENFKLILVLSDLSLPIEHFLACCRQFDFEIIRTDESFSELQRDVEAFYKSDEQRRGVDDCLRFSRSLCRILFPHVDSTRGQDLRNGLLEVKPVLQLFSSIYLYPELWNYASEMEWFGEEGLKLWYEEYSNVTNVLLGESESYEMSLLDSMESAMRVVSAIGALSSSTTNVLALLEECSNHEDIMTGVKKGVEDHIRQVHSKLSEIKDWFSNGVDEIAAAHSLFGAATLSGYYTITENEGGGSPALALTFEVDNGESRTVRKLQGEGLDQFIQQLSLIQNENSTTSADMQGFVDQYQVLLSAARMIITMSEFGFEVSKMEDFTCRAGAFHGDANCILKDSEANLRNFESWLCSVRENRKELLLFWTEELRDVYRLVQAVAENLTAPAVLADSISRLEPLWTSETRRSRRTLVATVQKCAATSRQRLTTANEAGSWLTEVSRFLGELQSEFGDEQGRRDVPNQSDIVLHSYCCGDNDEAEVVLRILHHVYQDRSPWLFEVLDGAVACSQDRIALFLERVRAFPAFRFVVVNAHLLESKALEKLLSFLSDREIVSRGLSFHCIQRGEVLHTAPWMSERSWDGDALAALNSSPPLRSWQSSVFSELTVVSSRASGTGKTRYIRDRLKSMDEDATTHVGSVVIHEGTTVASLIRSLHDKFPGPSQNQVLHVSFSFLPAGRDSHEKWLREMNYFFFCMVTLRSIYDPVSATSFSIAGTWSILFEMPNGSAGEPAREWLLANIPIIACYSTFREPQCQYVIDNRARRVCTYLRALATGTINRKFEGTNKRIMLVVDCSGSMGGVPFADAVRNAVSIFDSHVVEGDEFGVILFDHQVYAPVPLQTVGADKRRMRQMVQDLPFYGGGTSMYRALSTVLETLAARDQAMESWIVCLTDGVSDDCSFNNFRPQLMASTENLHVISIGINLHSGYEHNLRDLCQKYGTGDPKGFFVRSDGTTAGMDDAFEVVKSRIPVSQTFQLDGAMSDDECRQYMAQYLPSFVQPNDMISRSFWIRFLFRRVHVFDNNDSFNYNEKHDALGSSLMEVMLSEVERLLGENLRRDWLDTNHAQLIYDFTNPTAPEFRLVCTAPENLEPELRQKLSTLDLPGFRIPTKSDLDQRGTLDRFLSQALDIPLQQKADGSFALQCIDENGFILTLDFTMKLLSIHERVACRIPCLIEGETGVSKSALTKMYSILRNSSLAFKSRARTAVDLDDIVAQLEGDGFEMAMHGNPSVYRLRQTIRDAEDGSGVASRTVELLLEKMTDRPAIFAAYGEERNAGAVPNAEEALGMLEFFSMSVLERTFFDINVDSSLTEADFVGMFQEIRAVAQKLSRCDATVVVFLDEINTSSVLGLLKEVVIDHCIAGDRMEENIVVVSALNPPREAIKARGREQDLGRDWASGHYQVSALPGTMKMLKWSYGSLTHSQEKDFIYRRIEALHGNSMPAFLRASLTEVVSESHEIMRRFAQRNIVNSMLRARDEHDSQATDEIQFEAEERARSVVSLRDIQRVFALFEFFSEDLTKDDTQAPSWSETLFEYFSEDLTKDDTQESSWPENELQRRAMLLAVATVYYLRLDCQSRDEFILMLEKLPTEAGQSPCFLEILDAAMDTVVAGSEVPPGIAITRGLRENLFVTLVCSLTQTPLLIVGPPGTSKTLSVNVVDANANGTDSISPFYKNRPRLSLFHYQCSKQSTSKEISAVFAQAIQRQERIDEKKHRCVVFMDEAGLPESERESLKVLHYLLEGQMSAKAQVGFVAISNHVLDAAKSNRCVMLLRQEPDEEEMKSITTGVLFDVRDDGRSTVLDVSIDGALISSQEFASKLCTSYTSLFLETNAVSHLLTFFGLRDYIYFLKAVRTASRTDLTRLFTSVRTVVEALERNFNGVSAEELHQVSACFLKPLATLPLSLTGESLDAMFRHPMVVLKDALTPSKGDGSELERPRFKLIVDGTEDDSILRLLSKGDVAEVTKRSLYKLSNLPDNVDLERLRLISGVKFAALQGTFAVLSQTEPINESFYDLFNQRFREVTGRDGKVTLYANIAVGGISRRSLVRPDFECVVHVRESNMAEIPAPFLNRFEKYRLTLDDVMAAGWKRLGSMANIIGMARKRTSELAAVLQGRCDIFGWMESRETLDSMFVDMLPQLDKRIWDDRPDKVEAFSSGAKMFDEILCDFLRQFTSLQAAEGHIQYAIRMAQDVLPIDTADDLKQLLSKEISGSGLQVSLQSIVSYAQDDRTITGIFSILIQMVITRAAALRLIRLATPESIFSNRHNLPTDVVHEYFEQEHFSLKRLLMGLASESSQSTSLNIIHTRSDQFIHAIPSLPADRGISSEDSETVESVLKLVHEQGPHGLVIEKLSKLRSEALVRGAVHTWSQHDTRHVFLLLVDMSHQHALDRINFVRMVVEQHITEGTNGGKLFALLLHYSPSSSLQSQCYPALTLGGWNHTFLDSVGNDSSAFDADRFVALACQQSTGTNNDDASMSLRSPRECVRESIEALLPRLLPFLASQQLFYREQDMNRNASFYHRRNVLGRLMNTSVGDCTMADILCDKFSAMWLDDALFSTTRNASDALLRGTTQLSLSMSIHSVLVQSFQVFLGSALADANQWMNLDLIDGSESSADVLRLFGMCLRGLPVLPFEELVLQRKQSSFTRLRPLPASRYNTAEPRFPFFHFISGYFDELLETVMERHVRTKVTENIRANSLSIGDCLRAMMDALLEESENDKTLSVDLERRNLAKSVIQFVSETSNEESRGVPLFARYVTQFLEWKIGCRDGPVILKWLQSRIDSIDATGNIVALHVVARLEQMDLMKMVSIVSLVESLGEGIETSIPETVRENSDLFAVIFDTLEKAVAANTSLDSSRWSLLISSVLRQADAALPGSSCFEDEKLACRLRRLSLLLLWGKIEFVPSIEGSHWLFSDDETSVTPEDYKLSRFLESFNLDGAVESRASELLLQHFLSPTWLLTTRVFKEHDISYLLQRITEGRFSGPSHQTAVSLLRSAGSGGGGRAFGFSRDVLLLINAGLACENAAIFSSDSSKRTCVPHFIPKWLRTQSVADEQASNTLFFSQYQHCFEGDLSDVTFDLLLSAFACETEDFTSEQLFLLLQREMDGELSINRQTHKQLPRLRAAREEPTLRGTPLAAIALSARLLCFIAKVAHEVATEMKVDVFSGIYARDALEFVNELMALSQASWQSFFIGSILKLRGEGTLSAVLSQGGPLANLEWCQAWATGIPTSRTGAADALRLAETELAEAIAEEEQKARELRLCPHCQQPFMVAQANCGQFFCGRDAHQINGRPALNNTPINDTHGCGRGFDLRTAPAYRYAETILAPIRARIAEQRSRLDRCEEAAALWGDARSIIVPPLVHLVRTESPRGSFLPSSQLLSATETTGIEWEQNPLLPLLQLLWESSNFVSRLVLLPDLVELYLWLHDTFRFLVSREDAFRLVMRELMTEEQLGRRFDSTRVQHLLRLWERCRVGLNKVLDDTNREVHWQCETVSIPFDLLENTTLVSLLSEGQCPTDGNDFLFMYINETVDLYNGFAAKLATFSASAAEVDDPPMIPPKFLVRGLAGALKIGAVLPLTKQELNWMAESCWNSEEQAYAFDRIRFLLENSICLQDPPSLVASPLKHLRERFSFRDDSAPDYSDVQTTAAITKLRGHYFANRQDAQLVDEAQQLLASLHASIGDKDIRRTLIDNFRVDYDSMRAFLEGCRTFFDLLLNHGKNDFQTIGLALDELVSARDGTEQSHSPLQALGFPKISEKQSRLLLSLDIFQTVEFVNYAAHHLASEAYLFASLPLYMVDLLSEESVKSIKEGTDSICSERGIQAVVECIDDFVKNVLSFYEIQIVDGAAKTNSPLRSFLSENNFCDNSDRLFAILPATVSLRQYVSLRQLLHQTKLSFMFRLSSSDTDDGSTSAERRNESLTNTTRGRCWLWEDRESTFMDVDKKETGAEGGGDKLGWKLWFEQALPTTTESVEIVMEDSDPEKVRTRKQRKARREERALVEHQQESESVEYRAATMLQRFWRRESVARMDFLDADDSSYGSNEERMDIEDDVEPSSFSCEMVENESSNDRGIASHEDEPSNRSSMDIETNYGKPDDERTMRTWLDTHHLPQTLADFLLEQGARSIEDVCMLVEEFPEILDEIPRLDQLKLKKAAAAASNENV